MILLDTDTVTLLFTPHAAVLRRFQEERDTVGTTSISRIETLSGRFAYVMKAEDGQKLKLACRLLEKTEENLKTLPIIGIDNESAITFDRLREDRRLKKIGRADLLIACIALARRATLVTRNTKHFKQVPGLKIENWAD
jgi:tRNA(fMet)-specific endonuclease VapC